MIYMCIYCEMMITASLVNLVTSPIYMTCLIVTISNIDSQQLLSRQHSPVHLNEPFLLCFTSSSTNLLWHGVPDENQRSCFGLLGISELAFPPGTPYLCTMT